MPRTAGAGRVRGEHACVITCFSSLVAMGYGAQSSRVGPSTRVEITASASGKKKMKLGTGSRETMGNSTKINIPRWPDREPGSQASETRAALRKPTRQWALNSDEETRAGKSRQRLCLCPPGPSYRSSIHLGEKQTKSVKNQVNSCQQATLSTAFRSTRHQQEGSCHLGEATI